MNDRPGSRLEMLRFLERVQLADLKRTRRWIAAEGRRESERRRGEQTRPPEPDRLIGQGLNGRAAVYVHASAAAAWRASGPRVWRGTRRCGHSPKGLGTAAG
ncbi:hypothetical protein [Streptomyces mirabilis]|uniref:hypothetical protein n=1 Tax=Streptomyces mirabilis TaxID=68239 RepID=UPI003720A45E